MLKVDTAKVAKLMTDRKLSVNDVANKAGLSPATVEEIKKGTAKTPTDLEKVAAALGIPGKGNTLIKK